MNPTWSWKDRPNAISVSLAKELGFGRVVAISTGNHGSAAAAYSARAQLGCIVFCHDHAPNLQVELMQGYGAQVVRGGDQESAVRRQVQEDSSFPSTILCPRSGIGNPFGVEGFKTIALEIVKEMGQAPDCVFVPVGSGDGIYGIWKGFRELRHAGIIQKTPRMIACQACGADSAVQAFARGSRHVQPVVVSTVALSIAESIVGDHAMRAIYESQGEAISVTDSEIKESVQRLARLGFSVEMASASSLACALKLAGQSNRDESWVLIGSGASVKWPGVAAN